MANKHKYFDSVDQKVDFPEKERELLKKWYETGTIDKYLHKNDLSKKYFSFQDGPITANNPMGVHHAWGRSYKDLWQKYHNMKGYRQRFQNGFDCQGLWVEVEVEKELGFKSKKDIEKYGVDKFVQKCKDRVLQYSAIQTEQSKRLGYFMDWKNSYYTMSDTNNYMIWHFIKVCHENGWLYKGQDSVPWCPRCETAISQHEILTEDYKEVVHKSIFFELPIVGREKEYLLVWTTTPWTIIANIAVAIDSDAEYSLVEGTTGDKYWVATGAVKRIINGGKVSRKVKGAELVGLKYSAPFDHLPAVKEISSLDKFHEVVPTDPRILPISDTEGTGLVHTAVGAGSEDYKLGKKLGLPILPVIADDASYLDGFGDFSGKNAKKHPELIIDYLKKDEESGANWIFEILDYKHRYPRCWRCKTELVWKVTDEWYIAMDRPASNDTNKNHPNSKSENKSLRERMKMVTKKINWIPEFGLKRELDWLDNMHDWLISKKNRYWGLSLPIWECDLCGNFDVIGSKEELQVRSIEGWEKFDGHSPHKPFIDHIKLSCKCGGKMKRIEPVGNPWLDAGIVSFSTISADNSEDPLYLSNREEWKKWFPVDFITESFPGQFKNWFYSMIAMSTVLEDTNSFKTVLGFATLLDEKGQGMHKSLGNSIEFIEGADKIGVDVMRWMYARQNPSENLLFGYNVADETRRQFHLKLWNTYNYFVTYANSKGWSPEDKNTSKYENVLDFWIQARLKEVVLGVENRLNKFDAYHATELVTEFLDDLSNWYIRRSRDRIGVNKELQSDQENFFHSTYNVLINLSKILSPIMPFIPDMIFTNLTKEESIHLSSWPEVEMISDTEKTCISEMKFVRSIIEMGHAVRKVDSIALRQPLGLVTVKSSKTNLDDKYVVLLKDELNVKEVKFVKSKTTNVVFDTTITPELEEEGKARDLVRQIQNARKELGVDLDDKVDVVATWVPTNPDLLDFIKSKGFVANISSGEFKVTRS